MFDRNLMKLEGMHAVMAALVVLALLQAAAIAGQAGSLSYVLAALWDGAKISDVVPSLAAFLACFALLQLLRFGQESMLDSFALRSADRLRARLLGITFDPQSMVASRVGTATVASSATEDIDEILTYLRIIPPKIIGMAAISIPLLIVVFVTDWPSGIIMAVMFPVIVFFMIILGKQARDRAERQYGAYTRLSNRFLDTLRGMEVIKAFGISHREGDSVYSHSEKLRHATVRTLTTATLSSAVLDLCATFGTAAVAMMLAFRLMDGSIGLATGLMALILAPEYFAPIRSFASDFHASLDGRNALAATLEIIELDSGTTLSECTPISWRADSTLELKGVTFHHEGTDSGIDDLSLTLQGFERVAVVGPSGSGKSTLANVIAGFLPIDAGTVLLDGAPVELTSESWRRCVRVVPQSPHIFRATLAENIAFYNPAATREQIENAAHVVGLDTLVDDLPDGLDTLVGEGQRGLSGGQAHRVALARILLDDGAQIIVFDEPTAHLDIETELELKNRMLPLMENKLVVFATHRLHWVPSLDRFVELENGSVVRDGSAESWRV